MSAVPSASALAATLRIARRDALRARGRSALVIAMIGLPVLGVSLVSVLVSTYELTPEQRATRSLGQADASYADVGETRIDQSGAGGGWSGDSAPRPPLTDGELQAVLPPGSRSVTDVARDGLVAAGGDAPTQASLRALAYDDPVAQGIYRQVEGRAPEGPAEVVLTEGLAERLEVGLGDVVVLERTDERTVVGLVADADRRDARVVLLEPGTLLGDDAAGGRFGTGRLLVDVPGELTWPQVESANASGVLVEPRGPVPGAPPEPVFAGGDTETMTAVGLVTGMALLEVVLLAGPAFAVGAKRSRRQLALLAATGAERRDVRRTVLGGGLVLGAAGGVLGVVLGVAGAALALPVMAQFSGSVAGPFEVLPGQIAVIALVGVGTALLAAMLPARSASRQDVVAGLTGRAGAVVASRRLVPALGLTATAVGAAIALQGARQQEVLVILAGSVVAELGLVAATPTLVGLVGRLGPLLPVAPRMALRDASRNRSRTAPAVSAVLAAVAGTVAMGTFVVSQDQSSRDSYAPSAVAGSAVVSLSGADPVAQVASALERTLPAERVLPVPRVVGLAADGTDLGYVELAQTEAGDRDRRGYSGGQLGGLVVGDERLVEATTGAIGDELARALADGGVVAPPAYVADDGTATLLVFPPQSEPQVPREVRVDAVALPADAFPVAVVSRAAAALTGLPVADVGVVVQTASTPTDRQQDEATEALVQLGLEDTAVYVERGYDSGVGSVLAALAGVSALLVLGASGIATGLAAADGRADLSTLASVGATPGLRRRLAGFQSLVSAGLGTALGTVAGLVPAYAFIRAINQPEDGLVREVPFPFVVPWELLAVTGLVVPLLAALAAVVLTRSRLPLVRRIA